MIGVIGFGFVGQAYAYLLLKNGFEVRVIDPKYNNNKPENEEAYIVCVPTPSNEDGSCNGDIVKEVISKLDKPVLIKSTISPEVWNDIEANNLTFSPEFLRANNNIYDIDVNINVYLSRTGDHEYWEWVFGKCGKTTVVGPVKELITFKYMVNSFLATKVSFFNQVFDYCEDEGMNFEIVRKLLSMDNRIGESHTGVTEKRGWGGHCFPKDTSAITKHTDKLTLIQHAIDYNNRIRNK